MIYLFIVLIISLSVYYVLHDSMKTIKYDHYWTIRENGKVLNRKSGKITLYNNKKVFHGQLDYRVKKIIREGKEIKNVICEDNGVTRIFNIS